MTAFVRVGRLGKGYDAEQVEKFFAHARATYEGRVPQGVAPLTAHQVRIVGFDVVLGGYDVHQVDAALDRLEDALARREREKLRAERGDDAVVADLTARATKLYGRLQRDPGTRFDRGSGFELTYEPADVDFVCDRLREYFEGSLEMTPDEVRAAIFRSRRGSKGYKENQVDAFLDRAVEIMVMAE